MSLAVETQTNAGWNETFASNPTLVLTKPAGLVEGELLVLCAVQSGNDSSVQLTSGGWTVLDNSSGVGSDSSITVHLLYKIATSGDAEASDFTFTSDFPGTSGAMWLYGSLFRVSGNTATGNAKSDAGADIERRGTAMSVTGLSLTPDFNNSLLFAVIGGGDENNSGGTFTGYSVNGTNPTWTEYTDVVVEQSSTASYANFAVAAATQATAAEITSLSATLSVAQGDYVAIIASFEQKLDASTNVGRLTVSPVLRGVVGVNTANASVDFLQNPPLLHSPATKEERRIWTSETKTSTTWINEQK